ncbi:unnamed protein product [Rangifer tarandus platyrhynchus]|uniref:Uncharacterized protein n=1 Tax=Rangifer tarandus platyrhynchus TaxID=3082113 RepID=A0AC59Y8M4_RANTA
MDSPAAGVTRSLACTGDPPPTCPVKKITCCNPPAATLTAHAVLQVAPCPRDVCGITADSARAIPSTLKLRLTHLHQVPSAFGAQAGLSSSDLSSLTPGWDQDPGVSRFPHRLLRSVCSECLSPTLALAGDKLVPLRAPTGNASPSALTTQSC